MYKSAMAENLDVSDFLQRHFPLHWACLSGNQMHLRELLMSRSIDDIYQEDGLHGWTPMHWAAFRGQWKCLELIGEFCPLDFDVTNTRFNQSLAHIAALHSQAECIAWLVQRGVALGVQLGCLREFGHQPGIHEVCSSRTGETPTHIAAREGHTECLHWLLQHSVGYARQDHLGDTPLHKAAQAGSLDCVRLLMSHGTVLSTLNQNGQTPLDVASQHGHLACKSLLAQAMCFQQEGFFPTTSSPILMNGEGIYQNGVAAKRQQCQDMEMEEEMGSDGDAAGCFPPAARRCKRSLDGEEEPSFKRQRLLAPSVSEKMGTEDNNNVVSSYQGVLAMSVEPLKPPTVHHFSDTVQEVHALPTPSPQGGGIPSDVATSASSVVDHYSVLFAQADYDSTLLNLLNSDHGY